jgi:hypothetical protein
MCILESCGMSAACTWGLRGAFFRLVFFLCSPSLRLRGSFTPSVAIDLVVFVVRRHCLRRRRRIPSPIALSPVPPSPLTSLSLLSAAIVFAVVVISRRPSRRRHHRCRRLCSRAIVVVVVVVARRHRRRCHRRIMSRHCPSRRRRLHRRRLRCRRPSRAAAKLPPTSR